MLPKYSYNSGVLTAVAIPGIVRFQKRNIPLMDFIFLFVDWTFASPVNNSSRSTICEQTVYVEYCRRKCYNS